MPAWHQAQRSYPMQPLTPELVANFERRLDFAHVPSSNRPDYHKWIKFYLFFCQKYGFPPTAPHALGPFLTSLAAENYSIVQRHQASIAVRILLRPDPKEPNLYLQLSAPVHPTPQFGTSWQQEYRDLESAIKLRNYSARTLEAYRFWVARFQAFVRSRPTSQLSNQEVRGFLSSLAVKHGASASSQNQAFNSLLFFFRHVLRRDFGQIDGVVRAKRHRYIPVVLSRAEVEAVLAHLEPPYRLVVLLLYGCGLRLVPFTGGAAGGGGERGGLKLRGASFDWLPGSLEEWLGKPVLNETGVTNRYNIHLKWKMSEQELKGEAEPDPNAIIAAIREQLGLNLSLQRRSLQVLIVERARDE